MEEQQFRQMEARSAKHEEYLIRMADSEEVFKVEPLWLALYEHQRANGMMLDLPPEAFTHWKSSIAPLLGRFAWLFIVEKRDEIVGFLAGRIRSLPSYFGGMQVGFISEVFVSEKHRSQGLGRQLVETATRWFQGVGITRVELQVIMNNDAARNLYRQLGWSEELVQMIWQPSSTPE